ncbi:hypothetical protein CH338_24275, partial [Rhodoplanes elegans]
RRTMAPAPAGVNRPGGEGADGRGCIVPGGSPQSPLMPAKAGIQSAVPCRPWVPAFAGTSGFG